MNTISDKDLVFLFRNCPDMLCIASKDGYFLHLNKRWEELLGYSKEELKSKPFISFVHPDDVEKTNKEAALLERDKTQSLSFSNRYRKSNGEYIWLTWSSFVRGDKIYAIAKEVSDVHDQIGFYAAMERSAKIGGWSVDIRTFEPTFTDETYRIYGLPIGEIIPVEEGMNFYHEDYREHIQDCVRACIEEKKPYDEELKFKPKNRDTIWVRATGYPILNENDEVVKIAGTFQDINDLKMAQIEARELADQLSSILQNSPGMVYQFVREKSGEMYFSFVSSQAFDIYELQPEEFTSDPGIMVKMTHPEDAGDLHEKIELSATTLEQFEWDGRLISKSGKEKWIRARSIPQKQDNGSIVWDGIVIDITKEREMQRDLEEQKIIAQHSNRLAAIGQLSAGVGHEINNPLTVVMGLNSKIRKLLTNSGVDESLVNAILDKQSEACNRIKDIVDGLRTFARKHNIEEEAGGDINEAIRSATSLLSEIYQKNGVKLSFETLTDELLVSISTGHLQQVLINLLSNAHDAIRASQEQGTIDIKVNILSETVQILIKDSGPGIPVELRENIFDAFFTSKSVGQGTGLGLALCKNLVEASDGTINFKANPDRGTTFIIELPIKGVGSSQKTIPTENKNTHDFQDQMLSVLIIDDEEGVREVLADSLEELGCEVVSASCATDGLLEAKERPFDLIISDITMPGFDGFYFYQEIHKAGLAQNSKKYLMSGGDFDSIESINKKIGSKGVDGFITKPFYEKDLIEILKMSSKKLA